ncbi:MAG: DUF58 domain-containing protein [Thalassobius sp.]|nr:DUF58 domain-containing protein [Thalassovita sp.]
MQFLRSLYFSSRFYISIIVLIFIFSVGFSLPFFFAIGKALSLVFAVLIVIDMLLLYHKNALTGSRTLSNKLSNGDENLVSIQVKNYYSFEIDVKILDEVPEQFQLRDFAMNTSLSSGEEKKINYHLRPVERGEYHFGRINVFVNGILNLVNRRYILKQEAMVPVYPAYLQMRKYELLAISNRLSEVGIKKIRKLGHNMEFDQIKEYVIGDDFRSLNWKATARRNQLMVNQYQEEKSQQVYSIIDKGRVMKMPFEGMTLLDYAINASLVISNIAILKQDKAGLITFSKKIGTFLPAGNRSLQMNKILEVLYRQLTNFDESDFEKLYVQIKRKINHRSLILLYTNFETNASLERQLPYLKLIARSHLLVVIIFENTEIDQLIQAEAKSTEEVYTKTIAEQFAYEKKQVIRELNRFGIHAVLTKPQNLTVNTINKYLELKARGLI